MKNVICFILISLIVLFGNCQIDNNDPPKDSSSDEVSKMSDILTPGIDKTSSLTDEATSLTDKASSLTDKVSSLTDKPSSLTDKVNSLTDKPSSLSDKPSSLSDEEISLTDKPSSLTDKPSSLSDEANSLTDKASSLSDEEISLTDKASSLSDEAIHLSDKASSLSDEEISLTDEPIIKPNGTNDKESDVIPKEDPEKLADLTLSFRQLSNFKQEGDVISFYFYGLTTEKIEINYEIYFYVYLYLNGGIKDDELREVKCVAEENAVPTIWLPVQVPFKCTITGLKKQYETFKFSSSEFISGIPFKNPTLLDPLLTKEAIKNGEILDYSLDENKIKVPNLLVIDSIDTSLSESEGTFKILGKMSEEVQEEFTFRIPMLSPPGDESVCTIPIANAKEQITIECKFSGILNNQPLMFQQITVGDEQFLFRGFKTEPINCINGELKYAQKLLDLNLSFRQLNKFEISNNKITFKFFGLTTQPIQKGFKITLFLHLMLENGKLDPTLSQATCTLGEEVNPQDGQAQADFNCELDGFDSTKTYKSFVLCHTDYVSGIPEEKILLDPVKTAEAIEKGLLLDFSVEENKSKVPIIFTPSSIEESSCSEDGVFKITGTTNTEIKTKIQFDLPATYPEEYKTKCIIDTDGTELKCVIDNKLESKDLMFEQQILRNGLNELFTFGPIKSNSEMNCAEGNMTIFDDLSEESDLTTEGSDKTTEESDLTTEGSDKTTEGSDKTTEGSDLTTEGSDKSTEGSDLKTEGSDKTTEGSDKIVEGSDKTTEGSDRNVFV